MNKSQKPYQIAIILGVLLVCLAGVCAYQYLAALATMHNIAAQRDALNSARQQAAGVAPAFRLTKSTWQPRSAGVRPVGVGPNNCR